MRNQREDLSYEVASVATGGGIGLAGSSTWRAPVPGEPRSGSLRVPPARGVDYVHPQVAMSDTTLKQAGAFGQTSEKSDSQAAQNHGEARKSHRHERSIWRHVYI